MENYFSGKSKCYDKIVLIVIVENYRVLVFIFFCLKNAIFFIKLFNSSGYDLLVFFVNDSYHNFSNYWS